MYNFELPKKIIEMQKSSSDTVYQAAVLTQERVETLTDFCFQAIGWIPDEQKRLFGQWSEYVKQGQKELKKTIDQNYDALLSAYGAE